MDRSKCVNFLPSLPDFLPSVTHVHVTEPSTRHLEE